MTKVSWSTTSSIHWSCSPEKPLRSRKEYIAGWLSFFSGDSPDSLRWGPFRPALLVGTHTAREAHSQQVLDFDPSRRSAIARRRIRRALPQRPSRNPCGAGLRSDSPILASEWRIGFLLHCVHGGYRESLAGPTKPAPSTIQQMEPLDERPYFNQSREASAVHIWSASRIVKSQGHATLWRRRRTRRASNPGPTRFCEQQASQGSCCALCGRASDDYRAALPSTTCTGIDVTDLLD